MRFRLSTKPTWPELRSRLVDELTASFPATAFTVAGDDDAPTVAWRDGPAEGTVAGVVGDVPGWRVESSWLGPDPDAGGGARPLLFVRTFSERALALAAVRFHASDVRPYSPDRPGAAAKLWAILEEDDPDVCAYPLTARICDLLVAAPDPPGTPPDDPAARWAWKLAATGYDRLWSQAWSTVDL